MTSWPAYSSAEPGNQVVFGSGGAIRVLETNNDSSTSQEVASIYSSSVDRGPFVSGSHLYVADNSGALIIIDISDPKNSAQTGRESPRESRRLVCVSHAASDDSSSC